MRGFDACSRPGHEILNLGRLLTRGFIYGMHDLVNNEHTNMNKLCCLLLAPGYELTVLTVIYLMVLVLAATR